MKLAKLTRRLGDMISANRRHQRQKRDKLRELLQQMKRQQRMLEDALQNTHDPELRAGLNLKLQILIEQRKKGIRLRKALKQGN